MPPILRLAVLLLALGGLSAGVRQCVNSKAATPPVPSEAAQEAVSVFTLVGTTETGRKKWEVRGRTANLLSDTIRLSPVEATSFGQVQVHLTATEGWFHKVRQDVFLFGNVVMTTSDQMRLITDTLDWSAKKEVATTPDWVTVTRPGLVLWGKGGTAYPKKKQFRLQREVTVLLEGGSEPTDPAGGLTAGRVKPTGKTVITCDGPLTVDDRNHRARFYKQVRVRDEKGQIRSDRMDVRLDPKTKQMEEATCWGHVVIHQGNRVSYSNRAQYWPTAKAHLTGHVKMVMLPEEEEER